MPGHTSGGDFAARIDDAAITNGRPEKREREIDSQDASAKIALGDRYGLTRAERYFLKGTAVFAQRDFVFRAPVHIVEDYSRHFTAGQSSEVIDIDNVRRCDSACVLHDLLACDLRVEEFITARRKRGAIDREVERKIGRWN